MNQLHLDCVGPLDVEGVIGIADMAGMVDEGGIETSEAMVQTVQSEPDECTLEMLPC